MFLSEKIGIQLYYIERGVQYRRYAFFAPGTVRSYYST